jgi:4-aminobutyrate aminotransferase/(S)-3-amino-2-methylpropionate transaminase
VACAAALATIETIELDGLLDRAKQIETLMKDKLGRIQADDDRIGDVRGRGAMIAVELVKSGTADPDPELAKALSSAAHAAGVIVLTCGTYGNILRFLPPLTISDELLLEGLDVLALILADL